MDREVAVFCPLTRKFSNTYIVWYIKSFNVSNMMLYLLIAYFSVLFWAVTNISDSKSWPTLGMHASTHIWFTSWSKIPPHPPPAINQNWINQG